ncbi:3-methyl-2-oxobutanoate dehydrogenase subunit VorB [Ignavibacteria bacterium 4148-Me]|uniref:3-methyl-2-oxobutanoate dehydrogenase subunit VorB n=1 Tax=Rosettibacter primus TaxID=3111523 RepID=UPI00336C0A1B
MKTELLLMKGNEALAEAAIRAGCDGYFGYPITPQSEILEYLTSEANARTGMVVLQAESELAAINMVYGAACTGKKVMTSSSSPGISLMQEGISYIACAELPCLIVNVMRGGPGLGTIQPSQGDYFQAVKGGGHGDYKLIVLAPSSVQEMVDFVPLSFDLAFKYRNPVMILADGALGQMMEKVKLFEPIPRKTNTEPWATVGKPKDRERNVITSLHIEPDKMEQINLGLQRKYKEIEKNEVRFEIINCEDADIVLVAFGLVARICTKTAELARQKGIKVGVFRPITLFPFPYQQLNNLANKVKNFLVVEMNAGQMLEDVRLAINGKTSVEFHGRMGGIVPSPDEILQKIEEIFIGEKV